MTNTLAAVTGYLPAARPRYRWVECDWFSGETVEGEEALPPFRAEVRTNQTWDELAELDLKPEQTNGERWALIAPHVRNWNLLARDLETGEIVQVPPPAEAGPDAFKALEPALYLWLDLQVRTAHRGGVERPKSPAASAPTPEPSNAAG